VWAVNVVAPRIFMDNRDAVPRSEQAKSLRDEVSIGQSHRIPLDRPKVRNLIVVDEVTKAVLGLNGGDSGASERERPRDRLPSDGVVKNRITGNTLLPERPEGGVGGETRNAVETDDNSPRGRGADVDRCGRNFTTGDGLFSRVRSFAAAGKRRC